MKKKPSDYIERKPATDASVYVRICQPLKEKLTATSVRQKTSVNKLIIAAVQHYLDALGKGN